MAGFSFVHAVTLTYWGTEPLLIFISKMSTVEKVCWTGLTLQNKISKLTHSSLFSLHLWYVYDTFKNTHWSRFYFLWIFSVQCWCKSKLVQYHNQYSKTA